MSNLRFEAAEQSWSEIHDLVESPRNRRLRRSARVQRAFDRVEALLDGCAQTEDYEEYGMVAGAMDFLAWLDHQPAVEQAVAAAHRAVEWLAAEAAVARDILYEEIGRVLLGAAPVPVRATHDPPPGHQISTQPRRSNAPPLCSPRP